MASRQSEAISQARPIAFNHLDIQHQKTLKCASHHPKMSTVSFSHTVTYLTVAPPLSFLTFIPISIEIMSFIGNI